jgi:hypothetical protein
MRKSIAFAVGKLFALTHIAACQKRSSTAASATCDLGGGKTITTNYSSPRMKDRKISGSLVPFGQVWRASANEASCWSKKSKSIGSGPR